MLWLRLSTDRQVGNPPTPVKGRRHHGMLFAARLASKRRALQRPGTKVEGECDEPIELAVVERRVDQATVG